MIYYFYLSIAILAEVIATASLRASDAFTKPLFSCIVILGYCISFYFLSLTLRSIPLSIAYALWSGIGIILISLVSVLYYQQYLDKGGACGIFFIILGVVIINLYSKAIVR